jgi:hypothetical protein
LESGRLSTSKKFSNSQYLRVKKLGFARHLPDPEIIAVAELLDRVKVFQLLPGKAVNCNLIDPATSQLNHSFRLETFAPHSKSSNQMSLSEEIPFFYLRLRLN